MNEKLKFKLVPVSGALSGQGGFRAKLGRRKEEVVDFDRVIHEAREAGAFFGVSEELMKLFVRGILQTMIDKTAEDGKTRRIDDYLSVSLRVHGKFESADEDFTEGKHNMALVLRPLGAFRPQFKLRPVNVDHKRQFRIYSIADAEGLRKSGQVIWRKDFRIKGAELLQEDGTPCVACQMRRQDGVYQWFDPGIVSYSQTEIVCKWPEDFAGDYFSRGQMYVSVDKPQPYVEENPTQGPSRGKYVTVFPA